MNLDFIKAQIIESDFELRKYQKLQDKIKALYDLSIFCNFFDNEKKQLLQNEIDNLYYLSKLKNTKTHTN